MLSYSKDMLFQVHLSAEDIHLVLRGLKKLPYEDSVKIIREFEQVLLLPLREKQEAAVSRAAAEQKAIAEKQAEELSEISVPPAEEAKPKS